MMFSKIDKKVLVTLIAVLVVALIIGFFTLKSMTGGSEPEVQNTVGGVNNYEL